MRIAFDGDAVVFSPESDLIYKNEGLKAFFQHEKDNAKNPMSVGPFGDFLKKLSKLREVHLYEPGVSKVRIGIVTARNAPAHGLNLFLTDGRIEIDNNPVERTIRPIALNRKNALFAGHEAGAQNWAMLASLIETCKLNKVEPHGYIAGILTAIVNGHKQSDIENLLPWNFKG